MGGSVELVNAPTASELGEVGPGADVFALGTIIYRAITGHSAFPARTPAAAVYEAVYRDSPPPTRLDATLHSDLDVVIALALAKQPRQRYATPSELVRDLRAAYAGQLEPATRARARALRSRPGPALEPTLAAQQAD